MNPLSINNLEENSIEHISQIFKALSDPTRIRILHLLFQQECSVNEIVKHLDLTQSAISHQLKYLRQLHLVKKRREKNMYFYSPDDEHVIKLLEQAIEHMKHTTKEA